MWQPLCLQMPGLEEELCDMEDNVAPMQDQACQACTESAYLACLGMVRQTDRVFSVAHVVDKRVVPERLRSMSCCCKPLDQIRMKALTGDLRGVCLCAADGQGVQHGAHSGRAGVA